MATKTETPLKSWFVAKPDSRLLQLSERAIGRTISKALNECYAGTSRSETRSFAEMCFAWRLFVSHPKRSRYDFRPAQGDIPTQDRAKDNDPLHRARH